MLPVVNPSTQCTKVELQISVPCVDCLVSSCGLLILTFDLPSDRILLTTAQKVLGAELALPARDMIQVIALL